MAKEKIPVNDVLKLIKQGYSDADIIRYLREQGYSAKAINDAFNQAKIKIELARTAGEEELAAPAEYEGAEEEMAPSIMTTEKARKEEYYYPTPAPGAAGAEAVPPEAAGAAEGAYPYAYPTYEAKPSTESIEEIAEEIINEKWKEFTRKTGDIPAFKRKVELALKSFSERIKRLEVTLDKLQIALTGRVQEYGRDVKTLGTEMRALQGAFGKILQPLVGSVKELGTITEEMKKVKVVKKAKAKAKPKAKKKRK